LCSNTINQSRVDIQPQCFTDDSNKLIVSRSANEHYLFTGNKKKGYKLFSLNNNVTTQNESLAATNSDITSWRVGAIHHCVDVLVGYTTPSASYGTFSAYTVNQDVPAYDSGSAFKGLSSDSTNAWLEFTVDVGIDRKVVVVLTSSSGSTSNAKISVDGTDVLTGINMTNSTQRRYEFEITANPGSRVIRITNESASGFLNVAGINVVSLKDHKEGRQIDTYGYYRHSSYDSYLVQASANDFAVYDLDSEHWAGSYHGGESNIISKLLIDGEEVSLPVSGLKAGKEIKLDQSFDLDWSTLGGPLLNVRTFHVFGSADSYAFKMFTKGTIRSRSFFTTLFGVNESFDEVISPVNVNLAVQPDTSRTPLGRTNKVIYRKPSSGQTISIQHILFTPDNNSYGGPHIWRVIGSYNKYYYAPVAANEAILKDVSAFNIYTFE
jgi:hypothetical protein